MLVYIVHGYGNTQVATHVANTKMNVKNIRVKGVLRRFVFFVAALSLIVNPLYPSSTVYADDGAARQTTPIYGPQTPGFTSLEFQYSNNSEFFDTNSCGPSSSGGAASGASTELTFPKGLDEAKMADAINKFVDENKGPEGSILEGVGQKAVASGKAANVNPFLLIAQAKHESEMGSKNNANVKNANNSFGRSATASQPNWQGSRLWYKWSSGEASVDSSAPENAGKDYGGDQYSYLRKMFGTELDAGDWKAYFERYAPVADNNANPIYHPSDGSKPLVQQEVEAMVASASGGGASLTSSSAPSGGGQCCSASTTGTISGDTPAAKVMSYLTGKGLSVEVAAGFVGNFMQESGGGTFELSPTADNGTHRGIAQWDKPGRFAKLVILRDAAKADTLEEQIWYVGYELGLETDEGSGGYKDALDYIKQATDAQDAAARVDEKYEVSGGSALDARKKYAQQALDEYGDGAITPATGGSSSSCGGNPEASSDFVYYDQNDPKWQNAGYSIASSGCGPTSIAMIIATKKDKKITPVEVTKFLSDKGMWNAGDGIFHSGFAAAGEEYGMKVTEIGTDWDKAKEALKAGKFLTLSGQGGAPYTSGGHIIVARDITDDGKIVIANPAPMTDTPESTPYSAPIPGTAKMWIFE